MSRLGASGSLSPFPRPRTASRRAGPASSPVTWILQSSASISPASIMRRAVGVLLDNGDFEVHGH
jgi:hypothetical protein